jgi:hypothetical protein
VTAYYGGRSGLVEPGPVAAGVTDGRAAGHAFGVAWRHDLGGAGVHTGDRPPDVPFGWVTCIPGKATISRE